MEQKFDRIRQHIMGKPYERHIVPVFFAVENSLMEGEDEQVITKLLNVASEFKIDRDQQPKATKHSTSSPACHKNMTILNEWTSPFLQ